MPHFRVAKAGHDTEMEWTVSVTGLTLSHDETASSRGRRSADASRCMRKPNSNASSAKATGIGARSHHSGNTSVLMEIDPSEKLAAATLRPYHTKTRQQTSPTT